MSDSKDNKEKFYPDSYNIPEEMTGQEFLSLAIVDTEIYKWVGGTDEQPGDRETKKIIDDVILHHGSVIDIIRKNVKTPEDVERLMEGLTRMRDKPTIDEIASILEKTDAESS